jgi:hypothetical protein
MFDAAAQIGASLNGTTIERRVMRKQAHNHVEMALEGHPFEYSVGHQGLPLI